MSATRAPVSFARASLVGFKISIMRRLPQCNQ